MTSRIGDLGETPTVLSLVMKSLCVGNHCVIPSFDILRQTELIAFHPHHLLFQLLISSIYSSSSSF